MARLYCPQSAYLFALLGLRTQRPFPYTATKELRAKICPSLKPASFVVWLYLLTERIAGLVTRKAGNSTYASKFLVLLEGLTWSYTGLCYATSINMSF